MAHWYPSNRFSSGMKEEYQRPIQIARDAAKWLSHLAI
jgi:hypothetical protein